MGKREMIKNGDLPAMPVLDASTQEQYNGVLNIHHSVLSYGMTKREQFAMAAMQGLASESGRYHSPSDMAHDAVKLADALLAELEKSK